MTISSPVAAPDTSRRQRLVGPLLTIGGLAAATLALHARDPHVSGSWGYCPSRVLFGIDCPGCGGLRAVNNLTNGDLIGAASSNLLFVALIPAIGFLVGRWFLARWRGETWTPRWVGSRAALAALAATTVVFTVARNLPGEPWLAS